MTQILPKSSSEKDAALASFSLEELILEAGKMEQKIRTLERSFSQIAEKTEAKMENIFAELEHKMIGFDARIGGFASRLEATNEAMKKTEKMFFQAQKLAQKSEEETFSRKSVFISGLLIVLLIFSIFCFFQAKNAKSEAAQFRSEIQWKNNFIIALFRGDQEQANAEYQKYLESQKNE